MQMRQGSSGDVLSTLTPAGEDAIPASDFKQNEDWLTILKCAKKNADLFQASWHSKTTQKKTWEDCKDLQRKPCNSVHPNI
jgi:hypothetical protein